MPRRARKCEATPPRSRPSKRIVPPSGAIVPAIRLKTELLPAPLGPIIPRQWPDSSEKVTSSATTIAPNRFCKPTTSSSADIVLFRRAAGGPEGREREDQPSCDRSFSSASTGICGAVAL